MEEERKPIMSLNFEIEDIQMQYTAMEKYMDGLDKVSWEYKHADKIKTELYRAIAHHKFNLDKRE
jgi:hypothetical protein